MRPELVVAALERHEPAFATGELKILRCKPDRLRLKGRVWEALYLLKISGPAEQDAREVMLAGTLTPPDMERADQASAGPFGSREWRVYLPELRLDLWMTFEDAALETLPVLSDPDEARALLENGIRCRDAHRECSAQGGTLQGW